MLTAGQPYTFVFFPQIICTVFFMYFKIDGIQCFFDMQFPAFPFIVGSVPVVDAIGCIRGFLDLGQQYTGPEGMHSSCRHIKDITFGNLFVIHDLRKGIVLQVFKVGLFIQLLLKTTDQLCIFICTQHIPHFCFATTDLSPGCKLIIRMNLDRKPVIGIDQLDKYGKLVAELFIHIVPDKVMHIYFEQFIQLIACQKAVGHDAGAPFNSRQHPYFTAIGQGGEVKAHH